MSLIRCPECKRKISDAAEYCPQCGAPAGQMLRDAKARKTAMKSARRKNLLWLFVAVSILLFLGFSHKNKQGNHTAQTKIKPPKTTDAPITKTTRQAGLGISYSKAIGQLDRYFTDMEKRTLADNQIARTGLSLDKGASIEYTGPRDNLSKAYLMIGIPNNNIDMVGRNIAIAAEFLGNIFPHWPECGRWTVDAFTQIAKTHQNIVQTKFNKQIEIKLIKPFGMLTITVTNPTPPDDGVIIDLG